MIFIVIYKTHESVYLISIFLIIKFVNLIVSPYSRQPYIDVSMQKFPDKKRIQNLMLATERK
jgi:hypothetical protein